MRREKKGKEREREEEEEREEKEREKEERGMSDFGSDEFEDYGYSESYADNGGEGGGEYPYHPHLPSFPVEELLLPGAGMVAGAVAGAAAGAAAGPSKLWPSPSISPCVCLLLLRVFFLLPK